MKKTNITFLCKMFQVNIMLKYKNKQKFKWLMIFSLDIQINLNFKAHKLKT